MIKVIVDITKYYEYNIHLIKSLPCCSEVVEVDINTP